MSDDLGTGPRDAIASLVLAARLDGHPICLDSGPLIDYLARQRPVTDLLDPLLLDPAVPVVISTITLAEVLGRPALAGDTAVVGAIRRAVLALPAFRIVDLDQAHAVETALVRAGLASSCPTPRSLHHPPRQRERPAGQRPAVARQAPRRRLPPRRRPARAAVMIPPYAVGDTPARVPPGLGVGADVCVHGACGRTRSRPASYLSPGAFCRI